METFLMVKYRMEDWLIMIEKFSCEKIALETKENLMDKLPCS